MRKRNKRPRCVCGIMNAKRALFGVHLLRCCRVPVVLLVVASSCGLRGAAVRMLDSFARLFAFRGSRSSCRLCVQACISSPAIFLFRGAAAVREGAVAGQRRSSHAVQKMCLLRCNTEPSLETPAATAIFMLCVTLRGIYAGFGAKVTRSYRVQPCFALLRNAETRGVLLSGIIAGADMAPVL